MYSLFEYFCREEQLSAIEKMTSQVRALQSDSEVNSFVAKMTSETQPLSVLCRCRDVAKFVPPFSSDVIVSLSPSCAPSGVGFTEVNEALRALRKTTEELERKSSDEDRRDSGVSVRMHTHSSVSDSSSAPTSRDSRKISDSQEDEHDSAVFTRAAMAQKFKVSPFALDAEPHLKKRQTVKTKKTKIAPLAPVAKERINGEFTRAPFIMQDHVNKEDTCSKCV